MNVFGGFYCNEAFGLLYKMGPDWIKHIEVAVAVKTVRNLLLVLAGQCAFLLCIDGMGLFQSVSIGNGRIAFMWYGTSSLVTLICFCWLLMKSGWFSTNSWVALRLGFCALLLVFISLMIAIVFQVSVFDGV